MTFTQECVIPVACERLWDFLMDVPAVGRCVPGVESIEAVDGSAYRGGLKVQVGPIRLSLRGTITVEEQDRNAWQARMRAEANDRRMGGGIRARMSLTLTPAEQAQARHILTAIGIFPHALARLDSALPWRCKLGGCVT